MQILGFIVWIKPAPRLEFGLFMRVLNNTLGGIVITMYGQNTT